MLQCLLPPQSVQHGMACSVSYTDRYRIRGFGHRAVFWYTGPFLVRLIVLKLTGQVLAPPDSCSGVRVPNPVSALDSVVHMPSLVILGHIVKGGIDTTLHCSRARI
jgi:hypothetical protein